jgi:magnesium transporter
VKIEAVRIEGEAPQRLTGLDADAAVELVHSEAFAWIDVDISTFNQAKLRRFLVERLDFHPATLTDCIQPTPFHQAEIDMYVGRTYVITVHREPIPEFMEKFRELPPHIYQYRQQADIFLHHILDTVVNSFRAVLHSLQQRSDELELSILSERPTPGQGATGKHGGLPGQLAAMRHILRSRQALVVLRRMLNAEEAILRQLVSQYDFEGAPESSEEIAIYFRDVADRMSKYLEIIESEDRSLNHLMEVHHLVTNTRTNEIIIVLTVMSAIMLPLHLIVGFWGMNHDDLWLIHRPGGIWTVAALMLLVSAGLIYYFKRRRWI